MYVSNDRYDFQCYFYFKVNDICVVETLFYYRYGNEQPMGTTVNYANLGFSYYHFALLPHCDNNNCK